MYRCVCEREREGRESARERGWGEGGRRVGGGVRAENTPDGFSIQSFWD